MTEMEEPLRSIFCSACGKTVQLAKSIDPNQPMVRVAVNPDGSSHSKSCKPIRLRLPRATPSGPLLPFMKDLGEKPKRGVRPGG